MSSTALILERVSLGPRQGPALLEEVSLSLEPGQSCLVLAEPHQSLTALIKVAAGLSAPRAGRVSWFGHDATALAPRRLALLRCRIGLVRQASALVSNLTIGGNLTLGPMYHHGLGWDQANRRALAVAGPLGLEPVWDLRPVDLPVWQRRMALYARELIMEPELLLLELPELDLGGEEYDMMMSAVADTVRRGRAALLMGALQPQVRGLSCDLVLRLSQGRGRVAPGAGGGGEP